jgi:hypothetical protein
MNLVAQIIFRLILLHGPGGQEIILNREDIVTLREPRGDEGHMSGEIHCIINTVDGKFSAVVESCTVVREMAKENEKGERL